MPRSLKKGPYVKQSLIKKVQANIDSNKKNVIKTWSVSYTHLTLPTKA